MIDLNQIDWGNLTLYIIVGAMVLQSVTVALAMGTKFLYEKYLEK